MPWKDLGVIGAVAVTLGTIGGVLGKALFVTRGDCKSVQQSCQLQLCKKIDDLRLQQKEDKVEAIEKREAFEKKVDEHYLETKLFMQRIELGIKEKQV